MDHFHFKVDNLIFLQSLKRRNFKAAYAGKHGEKYSSRLKFNQNLETEISNFYAAGDGAGITRGLMQASVSGVLIAKDIIRKESVTADSS